ncbi:MAG TPA: PspC domain-containing protein [Burkholderiaceae bacterium]|nr:PspC domain-containing protein [Burkholderiaceae bacterium]
MSTADEIAKLHELLNKGALTQAEFEQAKARLLERGDPANVAINRYRLSNTDRWIAGVCGGIARLTGVDSWVWRLIFALGLLLGGFSLILYILLWALVPREGE